jgi:hypothetical protein
MIQTKKESLKIATNGTKYQQETLIKVDNGGVGV